jgi:hypothetical protein
MGSYFSHYSQAAEDVAKAPAPASVTELTINSIKSKLPNLITSLQDTSNISLETLLVLDSYIAYVLDNITETKIDLTGTNDIVSLSYYLKKLVYSNEDKRVFNFNDSASEVFRFKPVIDSLVEFATDLNIILNADSSDVPFFVCNRSKETIDSPFTKSTRFFTSGNIAKLLSKVKEECTST